MKLNADIFSRFMAAYENRQEPENERVFIDFFWDASLAMAAVLILASFAFGAWQLVGVWQDDAEVSNASQSNTPSLNRSDLQGVLNSLGARQAEFDSRKNSAETIADPSK